MLQSLISLSTFTSLILIAVLSMPELQSATIEAQVKSIEEHLPHTGLLVHLGCKKGELTVQLGQKGNFVIHAMDTEVENIKQANAAIRKLSIAGLVSTQVSDLKLLPFKNHLAQAVIVEDPDQLFKSSKLSIAELDRIVQPLGYIFILGTSSNSNGVNKIIKDQIITASYERIKSASDVVCLHKKYPSNMSDWPQYHYDGGRTGVSKDAAFKPPKSLQWVSGPSNYVPMSKSTAPGYQMNHNGVNIYFVGMKNKDRHFPKFAPWANSTIIHPGQHDYKDVVGSGNDFLYALVARNAFSGVKLWRRPLFYPRATVAGADGVLYMMEGDAVKALNIISGEELFMLGKAPGTKAFYLSDNTLLAKGDSKIVCFDLRKKAATWNQKVEKNTQVLLDDKRVFMRTNTKLAAINVANGDAAWKMDNAAAGLTISEKMSFVKNDILLVSARSKKGFVGIIAYAVEDGKRMWQYEVPKSVWAKFNPFSVKFAGGLILVVHFKHSNKISRIVGLDPKTGSVLKNFDTQSHKGICGPSISTEKFTFGDRPICFVDMETGKVHNFTVSRPSCGSGAMVASGMFYSQPIKCFCVKGSLKRHFLAIGSEDPYQEAELKETRLFNFSANAVKQDDTEKDPQLTWPTFRGNAARTASLHFDSSTSYALKWKRSIAGLSIPQNDVGDDWIDFSLGLDAITASVTDGQRVYTAAVHGHKVYAMNANDGDVAWTCHVDGRMEVPPTLYKGLCLVGTAKGTVYAINSKTGKIVWQFRAAPSSRMMMAYGQLESPWPVVGGVLIHKDMAFVVCGRTTEIDNGLWVYGLDPLSGKTIWQKNVEKQKRSLPDILVGSGDTVSMGGRYLQLHYKTGEIRGNIFGTVHGYDRGHILDRAWHCGYEPMWKQGIGFGKIFGRLLAKNEQVVSIYAAPRVLAQPIQHKVKIYPISAAKEKKPKALWESERDLNTSVDALVLSKNVLVIAERKLTDVRSVPFSDRSVESVEKLQSQIILMNVADGKILQTLELPGPIAADGLAMTKDSLLVSLMDGTVICYKAQ